MFVRKWLTKEEIDAKLKLRDKCRTLTGSNVSIASGKLFFVVVNGYVRKRKSDGCIDFKRHVNIQRLLDEKAD